MGRKQRVETPGAYFHVTTRGNNRERIYFGNWSGRLLVRELDRTSRRFGWRILAYVVMTNHYHFVVQLGEAGLSRGMCELNGRFAKTTNWRMGSINHLLGTRFSSTPIESDSHLLECCRYVVLNPVRALTGCTDPRHWRWSSMKATLGLEFAPACLDVGVLLGLFSRDPQRARSEYEKFIDEGVAGPRPARF
jgi:putative transposase